MTRLLFFIAFGFTLATACSQPFILAPEMTASLSSVNQNEIERSIIAGKTLYQMQCAVCHGDLASSSVRGRSGQQIKTAIKGSDDGSYVAVPQMNANSELTRLTDKEISSIALALGGRPLGVRSVDDLATCDVQEQPGRVTAHRLNRSEYNNTVQDLLGINTTPGEILPADGFSHNFDNNADVLTVTPYAIEKYLEAAEDAVETGFMQNSSYFLACAANSINRNCAETTLSRFAEKAFRRPLQSQEQTTLYSFLDRALQESLTLADGVKLGMQWVLVSPNFLFRIVDHPSPDNPQVIKELDGYELASRLSYFIWSSKPDEILYGKAKSGELNTPMALESEIDRMLTDDRAQALIDNFAMQWIDAHSLEMAQPNTGKFAFSQNIRQDMKTESRLLFQDVFFNDLSIFNILASDYTYLNRRLAEHYDIPGPLSNNEFVRVSLLATERRGILGHGSILTGTSLSERTSVVLRGAFVLENILCDEPPAPPPGAEAFVIEDSFEGNLRDQMQVHRANPQCASCHSTIDPIGFGLENFNAVGQFRTNYLNGSTIDSTGELSGERRFNGPAQLAEILKADPEYRICVSKKLMTYALGRELEVKDECTVNRLARDHTGEDRGISELIKGIVFSDPFRKQQGDRGGQ